MKKEKDKKIEERVEEVRGFLGDKIAEMVEKDLNRKKKD